MADVTIDPRNSVVRDCCGAATEQEQNACIDIVFPLMA